MPSVIDPQTMYVDDLPAIWSPVQWELTEDERVQAIEEQAVASVLWTMDAPEAILRLLLAETQVQRLYEPPKDYNVGQQGEWNPDLVTFGPVSAIKLEHVERTPDSLTIIYDCGSLGRWEIVIEPEGASIDRI